MCFVFLYYFFFYGVCLLRNIGVELLSFSSGHCFGVGISFINVFGMRRKYGKKINENL